ncbi:MAG: type 1 glutamine amidotransferase domain-containing protein [Candidatus Babeliales bacterium]
MKQNLKEYKVAILVAPGFEESEMTKPRQVLDDAGAKTMLISPESKSVYSWSTNDWSKSYTVDLQLDMANPGDYDALLLPGGVINPDKLRLNKNAIDFIARFGEMDKPIAAICHGPWTLIDAGLVNGKTLTSWPSIRIDLENAGAKWVDKEVVIDGKLVTSRKPEDIPFFNEAMLKVFTQNRE